MPLKLKKHFTTVHGPTNRSSLVLNTNLRNDDGSLYFRKHRSQAQQQNAVDAGRSGLSYGATGPYQNNVISSKDNSFQEPDFMASRAVSMTMIPEARSRQLLRPCRRFSNKIDEELNHSTTLPTIKSTKGKRGISFNSSLSK